MKRLAGIFSAVVGLSMIGMWFMFYAVWSIPELAVEPARIMAHIAAELVTAVMLLVGGWGLLANRSWGSKIYFLSTGALLYTMIQSPGYFIHTGDTGFVSMFAVLIVIAVFFLIQIIKQTE